MSSLMVWHAKAIKCVSLILPLVILPFLSTMTCDPTAGSNVDPNCALNSLAMLFNSVDPSSDLYTPVHVPVLHPKSYPIKIP